MIPEYFVIVGIFFNLLGVSLYIRSIVKGETKPNLVSWFMWMLAPFIGTFFQLKAGAGWSTMPVFMAGFDPLLVIIAALVVKNAIWKINSFDIVCGLCSLVALILYMITHNLGISIIFAILSDALAGLITLVKSWNFPETESTAAYSWCIISNVIGLLIIKDWSFTIYSFGIYLVFYNLLQVLVILYRRKVLKPISIS